MKKTFTILPLVAISIFSMAQNSLLKNPTKGNPFETGTVGGIEIIANAKDVALVAYNSQANEWHVLDIEDNDPDEAEKNQVTSIKDVASLIEGAAGQTGLRVFDIQINPISKAMYILAGQPGQGVTSTFVVKVTENGAKASVLDMSSITYSSLKWGGQGNVELQDMTWGSETIFVSSGTNWALNGQVAWLKAPFEHGTTLTNRATSMHKTNWGGGYHTDAPLEKMAFATIDGEDRLMGVTLCAPGFSVKTSELSGNGVLQVNEDFNINFDQPAKVVHQKNSDGHFLFNLHMGFQGSQLQRVGQMFLDGTPAKNNENNGNVKQLRGFDGKPTTGLTEKEFKIYEGSFEMIEKWDDENLLVLRNDELSLLKTYEGDPVTVSNKGELKASVYPNPTSRMVTFTFDEEIQQGQLLITTLSGQEVHQETVSGKSFQADLDNLASGNYLVKVLNTTTQEVYTEKLTITD